ncbi:glycosyltransferase [Vibrio splendidus]|uniref:glycosyltransferase n=1 Tax=Vibrio splendidus TaxID=29497 RepID=UPI0021B21F22|nr:glycosyltransferase [Vibrio splendidus]UWZ97317.1 glycosyltransferase [Vibrio splendidus]
MKKIIDDSVVAIFTYKQQEYIEAAIDSIYNQTVWPKTLYIFDDCSPDNTGEVIDSVVERAPEGLSIEVIKNDVNVGLVSQYNKLIGKFDNTLVVIQAGDDVSKPHRLETQYDSWKQSPDVKLVLSQFDKIDQNGHFVSGRDINEKFEHSIPYIVSRKVTPAGCTAAIDSDLFNEFSPIKKEVINEDRVFIVRSLLKGKTVKIMESLIDYRYNVGISTLESESKEKYISTWKTTFARELVDISVNISDCQAMGHDEFIKALKEREKYIVLLSDLFHGQFDSKFSGYLEFFKRGINLAKVFSFRQKMRRYFKNRG